MTPYRHLHDAAARAAINRDPTPTPPRTQVVAYLRDGSIITGRLDGWGSGWVVVDGKKWRGVYHWRTEK